MKSSGMKKWTMYEMWPATDSVVPQQAMLVSTLNVTHQRQLEMQLEAAKEQLLRLESLSTGFLCTAWATRGETAFTLLGDLTSLHPNKAVK